MATNNCKVLLYGSTGWIGGKMQKLLQINDINHIIAQARLDNYQEVHNEISQHRPSHILNCAGLTGRPNVDWCEDNRQEVIRVNVLGTINLIDVAAQHNIHVTNMATGCIYEYDEKHAMDSGLGFTEEDPANFRGSFYSATKIIAEDLIKQYDNVLNLRLRMPISSDLHARSFITKIINYAKVVNIPNSMSILDDLLPIALDMLLQSITGIYNFTNPGTLSHNQILDLYTKYIDPDFTYRNFSLEEQSQILKAGRSNNELNVDKLLKLYPDIPKAQDSIHNVFRKMAAPKQ